VVVRDFDFVGITLLPAKTDPVLIVNSNTVLALAIPSQSFKAVTGGYPKLLQALDPVQLRQLAPHNWPEFDRTGPAGLTTIYAVEQVLRGFISEGTYHDMYYNVCRARKPARGSR
jgi:hypothetical protein